MGVTYFAPIICIHCRHVITREPINSILKVQLHYQHVCTGRPYIAKEINK